jgi:hypothetical protein
MARDSNDPQARRTTQLILAIGGAAVLIGGVVIASRGGEANAPPPPLAELAPARVGFVADANATSAADKSGGARKPIALGDTLATGTSFEARSLCAAMPGDAHFCSFDGRGAVARIDSQAREIVLDSGTLALAAGKQAPGSVVRARIGASGTSIETNEARLLVTMRDGAPTTLVVLKGRATAKVGERATVVATAQAIDLGSDARVRAMSKDEEAQVTELTARASLAPDGPWGTLSLTGPEKNARVLLDGVGIGALPVSLALAPGSHRVVLITPGATVASDALVSAGQVATRKLEPPSK